MQCKKCGFPINPGSSFCLNCGEKQLPSKYDMPKYDMEEVEKMLSNLNLNPNDYVVLEIVDAKFYYLASGNNVSVSKQKCIINYDEDSLVFFILSKLALKNVSYIFDLLKTDILEYKFSKSLFSRYLNIKTKDGEFKIKVSKKVSGFPKQKANIEKLKKFL